MRKKFVHFAALLLALCVIPLVPAHAAGEETIIRVGLYYGSSALQGANLLNAVGSGYRFGYFDSDKQFVELASTGETAISVVKTTNVYYGSYDGYSSYHEELTSSSIAVGCYHLQLPDSYVSYEEAQNAASAYSDGFVAYIDGGYYARVGNYLTRSQAEAAQQEGMTVVGTSSYGVSVVVTGTDQILFQYDDRGSGTGLGVQPEQTSGGEKTVTWFKGYQWYGGFRYERVSGGDLTVVNMVPLEDYVRGILPYEMSNSWPVEALKAQAVCARSYTMTDLNRHSGYHFDICNTTHCQVYYGTGSANANTEQAVSETLGQYAWYNGAICQTFYHSCDGGATEDVTNVWTTDLPYLKGVQDPYEALVQSKISGYSWSKTYTGAELMARLNGLGYACGEIADLRVTKTTAMGNVYSVAFTDVNGKTWTISKDNARTILGVSSLRFTISGGSDTTNSTIGSTTGETYALAGGGSLSALDGAWVLNGDGSLSQMDGGTYYAVTGSGVEQVSAAGSTGTSTGASGSFVISGTGKGHNVGMSQWGAYAMAQQGYTYQEILKFYFTGVEIY
jgi:stage II sporulation protein D